MHRHLETGLTDEATIHLRRQILSYLRTHRTMTIASCRRGVSWAATVFYASDEFDLYFFSHPRSRHGTNMTANNRISAAIQGNYRHWRTIRGIQLEGRVRLLRSPSLRARFWHIYRKAFPFVDELFHGDALPTAMQARLSGIRQYRFTPDCVWYLDNRRGFGHRLKLTLKPSPTPPARGLRAE